MKPQMRGLKPELQTGSGFFQTASGIKGSTGESLNSKPELRAG